MEFVKCNMCGWEGKEEDLKDCDDGELFKGCPHCETDDYLMDIAYFRECTKCGAGMNEGYCCGDGEEYFCSDDCLHADGYTEEQKALDYEDGDIYWTSWEEE